MNRQIFLSLWRGVVFVPLLVSIPAVSAQAQELMPTTVSAWSPFAPRPETAPATAATQGTPSYTLNIYGNGVQNVYGGWRTRI